MSTIAPMRKPTRIPFFTQALVRHPVGCEASGSAERMRPAFSSSLNAREKRAVVVGVARGLGVKQRFDLFFELSAAVGNVDPFQNRERFEHGANLRKIFGARRHERQAEDGFEQTHFGHGRFHGRRDSFR